MAPHMTVTNCMISATRPPKAPAADSNYNAVMTVTNSTISGNTAGGSGGGIATSSRSLTMSDSSVAGNWWPLGAEGLKIL